MTQVAGDFYDFLQLDERRVTVLIADVSGHGVPAALIASMLKVAFAQQAVHAADPASVLAGLNSILNGVLDGQFVTAACAHIDLGAHAITYAGAGHPPAILFRQTSGDMLELADTGRDFRRSSHTLSYGLYCRKIKVKKQAFPCFAHFVTFTHLSITS